MPDENGLTEKFTHREQNSLSSGWGHAGNIKSYLSREVVNLRGIVVIKNPTDADYRQFHSEFFEQYPYLRGRGEPYIRHTYDIDNNSYIWLSTNIHATVEPLIDEYYETITHQSKMFDIKYSDDKISFILDLSKESEREMDNNHDEEEGLIDMADSQQEIGNNVSDQGTESSKKDLLFERLQNGIRDVLNSDKFRDWLKTGGKLLYNHYSFNNSMLIWLQKPDASYVMGYEQWKEFGRNVKMGSKSASILMPVMANEKYKGALFSSIKKNLTEQLSKNAALSQAVYQFGSSKLSFTMNRSGLLGIRVDGREHGIFHSDEELKRYIDRAILGKVPVYFTAGSVFDVKDVTVPEHLWLKSGYSNDEIAKDENGKAIKNSRGETKIINTPERQARFRPSLDTFIVAKDPEKMAKLYDACVDASQRKHVYVYEHDTESDETLKNGAKGYYDRKNNMIVLAKGMEITEKCAVLFHELGHADLHKNLEELANKMGEDKIPQSMREVQAEAVAYMTATTFGIETDTSSFAYLASYSKGFELQEFQKSLEVIYKECQALTADIKAELDICGLNLDLTPKASDVLEPDTIKVLAQRYMGFAIEQENKYVSAMKELPGLLKDNKSVPEAVDILKEQKNNLDIRKENIETIKAYVSELAAAVTRNSQDDIIGKIAVASNNIYQSDFDFNKSTANFVFLIDSLKGGLKSEFDNNPQATLAKMKDLYPRLNTLTEFQMKYLEKSLYISREYGKLLRSDPGEFVKKACDRADVIAANCSKNGTIVEIVDCEQWTDKPIFEKGVLCHPKVADDIIKQAETQIRGFKAEAEKRGDYFPYCKCSVTVFSPIAESKNLSALFTQLSIGDGTQKSLQDHLEDSSKRNKEKGEIVANFTSSLRERSTKDKVYIPSIQSDGNTFTRNTESEAVVPKTKENWSAEIVMARNEHARENPDSIGTGKDNNKQTGIDNSKRRNDKDKG